MKLQELNPLTTPTQPHQFGAILPPFDALTRIELRTMIDGLDTELIVSEELLR